MAQWAAEREIPMLHRTQDVALPKEYAGVWKEPQDMTRIMRALIPSSLEVQARPHAALGLARYTPMTSPLRRYPDLINEAQLLHWLTHGTPRWDSEALSTLLVSLNAVLDAAGQVQQAVLLREGQRRHRLIVRGGEVALSRAEPLEQQAHHTRAEHLRRIPQRAARHPRPLIGQARAREPVEIVVLRAQQLRRAAEVRGSAGLEALDLSRRKLRRRVVSAFVSSSM